MNFIEITMIGTYSKQHGVWIMVTEFKFPRSNPDIRHRCLLAPTAPKHDRKCARSLHLLGSIHGTPEVTDLDLGLKSAPGRAQGMKFGCLGS